MIQYCFIDKSRKKEWKKKNTFLSWANHCGEMSWLKHEWLGRGGDGVWMIPPLPRLYKSLDLSLFEKKNIQLAFYSISIETHSYRR